jgi:cell division protein FtsA
LRTTTNKKGETVGVVDFGSREIRVLIARKDTDGTIQIIGHGIEPARGCVSQGMVQDLTATQVALKKALAAAEKEAQMPLKSIFCAINGKNVDTFIREGNIKLDNQACEISHMNEALNIASHDILAPGKRVTSSVTAQEWYVDDLRVTDPIGIRGHVLKTRVHFALVPAAIIDNLVACIQSQGMALEDFIFTPLASAQGCLTPEEMELGVAVLDMGRSTTGLAVYRDYRIHGTQCFEWGGYHLTRDVSAGLHVSFEEADELIMTYGISNDLLAAENEEERVVNAPPRPVRRDESGMPIKLKTNVPGAPAIVSRKEVETIIYERGKELMTKIRQYLQARALMKNLVCGLVFTGGASEIKNHVELAKAVLQVSARRGTPNQVDILPHVVAAPAWSAAVGVVRHAFVYRAAARSGRIDTEGPGTPLHRRLWRTARKYFM